MSSCFKPSKSQLIVVSYDFDNTLKNQYTGEPVYPILQRMKDDYKKGETRLIICTSRYKAHTDEIREFLKVHDMSDVPIYATNHQPKSPVLLKYKNMGYHVVHYDDQEPVLDEIIRNTPGVTAYKVLYKGAKPETKYKDIVVLHN